MPSPAAVSKYLFWSTLIERVIGRKPAGVFSGPPSGPRREAAFSLKKEQASDIIESVLGYHIIELEDKKTENGEELVKIRQIFARKKTFAGWLDGKIKEMKIYIPLKDYYWNKEKGALEFSNEEMREFEKNIAESFQ